MEDYPKTITAPPAHVNGKRVLGWAELAPAHGHYPGGIVLVYDAHSCEYVTWEAYTRDGGKTWEASAGDYLRSSLSAWVAFTDRIAGRNLASE